MEEILDRLDRNGMGHMRQNAPLHTQLDSGGSIRGNLQQNRQVLPNTPHQGGVLDTDPAPLGVVSSNAPDL